MGHRLGDIELILTPQADGAIWRFALDTERLPSFARGIQDEGGQLLALWGSDDRQLGEGYAIHIALMSNVGLVWTSSTLPADNPSYPDLAAIFPQADRMQRAAFDLLGIRAEGAVDARKWLRHNAWPENTYPLRRDFAAEPIRQLDAYPFIRVEGDGVHEIPVGPIHAGTIEPGHFRFSIIGDRILKLEERFGYTHKGTEKRFEGLDLATGAKLAGRVSGDSHSAFAWAYCLAVETATASHAPDRAVWLRALFLEIERIANHLGDLGYLGNDAALTFGFMQFWRLREDWLRLSAKLFGHRYLFDCIVPGGVAVDISAPGRLELEALADRIEAEVHELKAIYDEHSGLQDRFTNAGIDAGSCNGCELEIHALGGPYYNIEGIGVKFATSPRHADLLLVTGPVSRHLETALKRTYDATPEPKWVVAMGDCGCGAAGAMFGPNYATIGAVREVIPVDVDVPGCPAHAHRHIAGHTGSGKRQVDRGSTRQRFFCRAEVRQNHTLIEPAASG